MPNSRTALILIDIQDGLDQLDFYGGKRNNPQAEANCAKLLTLFRDNQWPIFHVQHCSVNPESPLHPSNPGNTIKEVVRPISSEPIFKKSVNSCFVGTGLQDRLLREGIASVIIVGLTTEHCISTSARMSANLGFDTTVISDATAAFQKQGADGISYDAETVHQVNLACLKDEFATIKSTQEILESLRA